MTKKMTYISTWGNLVLYFLRVCWSSMSTSIDKTKSKTQEQKEILVKPLLHTLLWFYTLNPTTIDPYSLKPFFNDLLDKGGLCIVV